MELQSALRKLGIQAMRPFQSDLLEKLQNGQDIICLAPTSAGKSLVFQTFALTSEKLVIVIEPHLALELDQVAKLQKHGIPVACINGLMPVSERKIAIDKIKSKELRLLYLTPEMLQNKDLKQIFRNMDIAGIMVDEAHAISKQGAGFREDYLKIGSFIDALPNRPIVGALTATATRATEKDITEKLHLQCPYRHCAGVTRDNIELSVTEIGNGLGGRKDADIIEQRKREKICRCLNKQRDGRIVIYCNTISRVENLYEYLQDKGYSVEFYHGKCDRKPDRLRAFAQGDVKIMVATNAFGLGVDIPDIRLIIHHSPLMGLDDYVQEVGRAGRDGKKSKALLLWHEYDFTINERLIREAQMKLTGRELKNRLDALKALHTYAKNEQDCRWQLIRDFFSEDKGKRCKKRCDNCRFK